MSITEKIIGLAGVVIICVVFIIVMNVVIAFCLKWRQKGVNPLNKFPRNPKGGKLTDAQQRALNVGAVLAGTNSDFCDSLQTSKAVAKKTIAEILERDWEITSAEDAVKRLEGLKYNGHRHMFNRILKNASSLLASGEYTSVNPGKIYEQTGLSLLDQRILTEYADEVALVEQHIDLMDELLKASAYEDIEKYQSLFGDEETFGTCIQIFHRFYDQCCLYVSRIVNLEQTLPDLREKGLVGDISELEQLDATAWDMGRMVNVARYACDCGYISENVAWEYIFFAEQQSASCYPDWASFGRAYVIGRAIWGGKNLNLYETINIVKSLKEDSKSPWALIALH